MESTECSHNEPTAEFYGNAPGTNVYFNRETHTQSAGAELSEGATTSLSLSDALYTAR